MVEAERAKAGEGHGRTPRLVLASRSPRRRQILTEQGLEHDTIDSGVDDSTLEPGRVGPETWAAALAYLKAAAGAERSAGAVVLGADTVCVKDGHIVGQARDEAEASRILRSLESARHDVVTGVALVWGTRRTAACQDVARPPHRSHRRIFTDRARVRIGAIGEGRLREYVVSGEWRGKEGAYNLSERLEAGWPIEFEGDPGTIMGLPTRTLLRVLRTLPAPPPPPPAGEC